MKWNKHTVIAVALTAEQQIALALIEEAQGLPGLSEHRFNDGENIYVVQLMCTPIDKNEHKGMYNIRQSVMARARRRPPQLILKASLAKKLPLVEYRYDSFLALVRRDGTTFLNRVDRVCDFA